MKQRRRHRIPRAAECGVQQPANINAVIADGATEAAPSRHIAQYAVTNPFPKLLIFNRSYHGRQRRRAPKKSTSRHFSTPTRFFTAPSAALPSPLLRFMAVADPWIEAVVARRRCGTDSGSMLGAAAVLPSPAGAPLSATARANVQGLRALKPGNRGQGPSAQQQHLHRCRHP